MITHELISNTPEWDAHRLNHDNASEVAAVLGLSKTMTRTELMHMKHTGLGKEFSNWVRKNILDHGHEVEAMARPIVEEIIGENLYPVTCTLGRLGASLDGLTMDELLAFEHKQWNAELAALVADGVVPDYHMPQCQQILLITKAEKLYFVVSDGTRENMVYTVVLPDPAWFERIEAGWKQFHEDLANYKPEPAPVEVIGRTPETLPALHIEVTGMVTASNLQEYKEHALAVFASINRDLKTDQDFADARKAVKWCADIESRIKAAKAHAMSQTESLDTLFRTMDDIGTECKRVRLEVDGLVKTRDSTLRAEIVAGGRDAFNAHIDALNARLGKNLMPTTVLNFAGVIKGMSKFDNMRDAVATELARLKIEANATADRIQSNINAIAQAGHDFLFADSAILVQKDPEFVAMAIKNRVADHAAKEAARIEAERAQIRAEEQAKAQREAAEQAAKEAQRIKDEAYLAGAEDRERARQAEIAGAVLATRQQKVAPALAQLVQQMPPDVRQAMAAPKKDEIPTLTLGEISARLGFNVSTAFLAALGFEATTVRAAKMYHSDDFKAICEAIKTHIGEVQDAFEAATA